LLAAERKMADRLIIGASKIGRDGDLQGVEALLKWRLQALQDGAPSPVLRRASFVEMDHRLVDAAIGHGAISTPRLFALEQNRPNPFNPETSIDFTVPAESRQVRLEIFNMLGQRVAVLWDGEMAAGGHRLHWRGLDQEGRPVASGIYTYRLQSGEQRMAKRMVLVR
jgi:hypothetical protein